MNKMRYSHRTALYFRLNLITVLAETILYICDQDVFRASGLPCNTAGNYTGLQYTALFCSVLLLCSIMSANIKISSSVSSTILSERVRIWMISYIRNGHKGIKNSGILLESSCVHTYNNKNTFDCMSDQILWNTPGPNRVLVCSLPHAFKWSEGCSL